MLYCIDYMALPDLKSQFALNAFIADGVPANNASIIISLAVREWLRYVTTNLRYVL